MQVQATLPMKLSVVLVGLDRSGAFGEAQDAEELEALLSHSLRKVCPVFAAERVESRACFAALAEVTHAAGGLDRLETAMARHMGRSAPIAPN